MLPIVVLTLLAGLGFLPSVLANTYCSADVPCEIGCCGKNNVCGLGPDYCSDDKCINSCDAKAECNPGDWDEKYVNATTCPLNVYCSSFGFCGTTEFCGNKTVARASCDASSQSHTCVIGYYNSAAATRSCGGMVPLSIPQGVYWHIYLAFFNIDPDTWLRRMTSCSTRSSRPSKLETWDKSFGFLLVVWDFSDDG
ncbi:hypothetical protein BDV29DRAFT_155042 [Aspergillus leporis]|jgi:chitinase|uniref:Chitin-binding type-1 domain-containing protein n=1 Tax=Aspergillus leporis TaxID=41062 RepID=A0A5N5X7S1_9EURO|nr:hypothetical protein BDV29DRAFT_155042 [Aspergillus leporis]